MTGSTNAASGALKMVTGTASGSLTETTVTIPGISRILSITTTTDSGATPGHINHTWVRARFTDSWTVIGNGAWANFFDGYIAKIISISGNVVTYQAYHSPSGTDPDEAIPMYYTVIGA